ncbi:VOC family protein [Sporosarcina sp. 6E9]|uniref:VOC family protein n=1 Tax=Sporosarcina sp. 6E9 TaxID=2819235 RepID=UPI001B30247F|nr:VOC family protein [Sporosarcina sp. 6E9]
MISKVGQIMLYVNNQDKAIKFWTEIIGFSVKSEEDNGQGMKWIEIAPSNEAETALILHNKALIAQMQPELYLGTPSLIFFTENLDEFHTHLTNQNITVGEIMSLPSVRVFNFADYEENYFAIMEKGK